MHATETRWYWQQAKKHAAEAGWVSTDPGYWDIVTQYYLRLSQSRRATDDLLEARYGERPERNPGAPPSPSSPHPRPRRNPPQVDARQYERFHGVEPSRVEAKRAWVPGAMVLMGTAVDVGYRARDSRSSKGPGPYVHDFGSGVRVYRRARQGERVDKTWSSFPLELMVLGAALGFTYRDAQGASREVRGGQRRLAVTPNQRTLVLVGGKGVEYLIEGGNMHVADWIRE